jgi:hypothetical protein
MRKKPKLILLTASFIISLILTSALFFVNYVIIKSEDKNYIAHYSHSLSNYIPAWIWILLLIFFMLLSLVLAIKFCKCSTKNKNEFLQINPDFKLDPIFFLGELFRAHILKDLDSIHNVGANFATEFELIPLKLRNKIAEKYYRYAAKKGHALSQYDLAFMIMMNEVPYNDRIKESKDWLEKASDQNLKEAIDMLNDIKIIGDEFFDSWPC